MRANKNPRSIMACSLEQSNFFPYQARIPPIAAPRDGAKVITRLA